MIYHFAAPEHTLREIAKTEEKLLTTIPLINGKGLSEMIAENLKNLANVEAVIVDRWQLSDSDQELEAALQLLMGIGFNARILLLTDDLKEEDTIQLREGYTILNQAHRDITAELTLFMSGKQLQEEVKSIWIGISSAENGVGATTLAMQLTTLLASIEAKACYIEADGSKQLEQIAQWYNMTPTEAGYQYKAASFVSNAINEDMQYNIIDFGQLSGRKLKMFNACQVKIIVADAKPYGLKHLENVLRLEKEIEGRLDICINFAGDDKAEQDRILDRISALDGDYRLHINRLNPDFFSVTGNLTVLKRLMSGIVSFPERENKKAVLPVWKKAVQLISTYKQHIAIGTAACLTILAFIILIQGSNTEEYRAAKASELDTEAVLPEKLVSAAIFSVTTAVNQEPDIASLSEGSLTETGTEQTADASSEDIATEDTGITETQENQQTETQADEESQETETPATEAETDTEATTEAAKKKKKKKTTTEAATEETTESSAPDISKYDQDILSGSEVKKIIQNYGSWYSIIVETRNNGTGNYGLAGNSSQDIIDSQVSFYASLMYSGTDVSGLYLLQQ